MPALTPLSTRVSMEKVERGFLIAGILILTLGFLLPWVRMDPLAKRAGNLRQVEALIASMNWSEQAQQLLAEKGLVAGMSPTEIWAALSATGHTQSFALVQKRERLYVWHYFVGDGTFALRATIVISFVWYLAAVGFLLKRLSGSGKSDYGWFDEAEAPTLPSRGRNNPPLIFTLVALVLFALQLPYMDSFGYTVDFSMALLDILTGARVAFAPRVLIPLGFFLILLAGVEEFASRRINRQISPDL